MHLQVRKEFDLFLFFMDRIKHLESSFALWASLSCPHEMHPGWRCHDSLTRYLVGLGGKLDSHFYIDSKVQRIGVCCFQLMNRT